MPSPIATVQRIKNAVHFAVSGSSPLTVVWMGDVFAWLAETRRPHPARCRGAGLPTPTGQWLRRGTGISPECAAGNPAAFWSALAGGHDTREGFRLLIAWVIGFVSFGILSELSQHAILQFTPWKQRPSGIHRLSEFVQLLAVAQVVSQPIDIGFVDGMHTYENSRSSVRPRLSRMRDG